MISVDNHFGLSPKTITAIHSVFLKYASIEKVIIYGSRAKGNYRQGSDIDLTLFGDGITDAELAQVRMALDDLPIPYQVDLCLFIQLDHTGLQEHIQRVGKIFYEKNESL